MCDGDGDVGQGLAERGHILVYGGATVGVMGALAAGALGENGVLDFCAGTARRKPASVFG